MVNDSQGGRVHPTHNAGGTLDLILVGKGIGFSNFQVHVRGVAGSDHRLITALLTIEGLTTPEMPLEWTFKKDVDWDRTGNSDDTQV